MKKIILTVVVAFTIGMLSVINTTTISSNKTSTVKTATVFFNQKTILATAD